MPTIMADNDVQGHLQTLLHVCNSDEWRELWQSIACDVQSFEDLGLARDSSDRQLWLACQRHQIVLITGNRNEDGPDSLETAIRELADVANLPVLTIAEPAKLFTDRAYLQLAAVRLMQYLLDLEQLRGAGRLYLP